MKPFLVLLFFYITALCRFIFRHFGNACAAKVAYFYCVTASEPAARRRKHSESFILNSNRIRSSAHRKRKVLVRLTAFRCGRGKKTSVVFAEKERVVEMLGVTDGQWHGSANVEKRIRIWRANPEIYRLHAREKAFTPD